MGFAAQATYWSAVDLHKAVMTSICEALTRPLRGAHPVETPALAAKADLLVAGVAVDEYSRVMVENDASKVCEASPWAADKEVAEVIRTAHVQASDSVAPKSLARDMAFGKLQSRILSAAEAVQAAKPHHDMQKGHRAQCTAVHKSPTELAQNAQWRMATALRLGATRDAGPRSTCALRKGNDGDMCEQSLVTHPVHPFLLHIRRSQK